MVLLVFIRRWIVIYPVDFEQPRPGEKRKKKTIFHSDSFDDCQVSSSNLT